MLSDKTSRLIANLVLAGKRRGLEERWDAGTRDAAVAVKRQLAMMLGTVLLLLLLRGCNLHVFNLPTDTDAHGGGGLSVLRSK